MPSNPNFSLAAIRQRADVNDNHRREHSLPYADSDIFHLLNLIIAIRTKLEDAIDGGEENQTLDSWLSDLIRQINT